MGHDLPLAYIDLPLRAQFAQVIVGPPVAESELQCRPVEVAHQSRRQVEARALGLEPADEAVEPAHFGEWEEFGRLIRQRCRPARAGA